MTISLLRWKLHVCYESCYTAGELVLGKPLPSVLRFGHSHEVICDLRILFPMMLGISAFHIQARGVSNLPGAEVIQPRAALSSFKLEM